MLQSISDAKRGRQSSRAGKHIHVLASYAATPTCVRQHYWCKNTGVYYTAARLCRPPRARAGTYTQPLALGKGHDTPGSRVQIPQAFAPVLAALFWRQNGMRSAGVLTSLGPGTETESRETESVRKKDTRQEATLASGLTRGDTTSHYVSPASAGRAAAPWPLVAVASEPATAPSCRPSTVNSNAP